MSVRRMTQELDGMKLETVWHDLITTVVISDGEVTAKGNARWYLDDVYSEEVGQKIAFARALERYARKTEKKLLKELAHA